MSKYYTLAMRSDYYDKVWNGTLVPVMSTLYNNTEYSLYNSEEYWEIYRYLETGIGKYCKKKNVKVLRRRGYE